MKRKILLKDFNLAFFLTCYLNIASQVDMEIKVGIPININRSFNQFISDSKGLNKNISIAGSFGVRYRIKKNFFIGINSVINNYYYSNDTNALSLEHRFAFLEFGKEFNITSKLRLGFSLNAAISKSVQTWYSSDTEISFIKSFNKSNYSTIVNESKFFYPLGSEIYCSLKISKRTNIMLGAKNSITSLKKLDFVEGKPIYGFYIFPFFGIRVLHRNWVE